MEKRRVVITGLGTVNPLGNNVADSWAAARAGKCGIGPITQFDTTDFKCKLAGEVKGFDPETVVDKKEVRKMARFTLLALGAATEAIADSGLDTEAEGKDIGVILSSGIGGLPTIEEQHARGEEKGMEKVSPYFVPMAIANMAAAQVAIRFGLKGMCTCPVTACAGGTNAVGDAFHRIRDGYEPVMVCGGAESCISPLGIGGFTSMKALSTATDPDAASLPFDARRGGFVMGEGSGVLVLEELEHARARGAHIYAEVVGYGANCDAYHFTAPAPGGAGAIDCMKLTLVDADIAPEQVDHINAHGTGTHMNDACETAAIHAVFGAHAKEMTVVSTKSMTGHLLGGAGGIDLCIGGVALHHGVGAGLVDDARGNELFLLRVLDVAQTEQDAVALAGGEGQVDVQRTHRCPAVGNAAGAVPGADGLRVCRAAVHAAEGIPGGVKAVHRAVCPEHGVVVAALAVLGLVVDDAALYLHFTGGVVALEVGAVVHGIPQAELHIAEQIQLLDNGAAVAHCHPVQLTGIPLGDEQLLPGGHAVLFALQNGVAQTVAAAVTVQRGLGGLPARVPYGFAILDVDPVAVHVQRGIVVAVAGQAAHPGVPVKAVTARCVGDQTEEVFAAKVVDPGQGRLRGGDDVFLILVIKISELHNASSLKLRLVGRAVCR